MESEWMLNRMVLSDALAKLILPQKYIYLLGGTSNVPNVPRSVQIPMRVQYLHHFIIGKPKMFHFPTFQCHSSYFIKVSNRGRSKANTVLVGESLSDDDKRTNLH